MTTTHRIVLGAVALVLIIAASFFFFVRTAAERGPFTFGAILPMTGAASSSGAAQERGLRLAARELEAKTGDTVGLLVEDSALVPEQGRMAARKLIAGGAGALYSSYTVVTREVSEVARQAKIALFYDSCNCGFAQENPYAFQLYVDPRKECREAAMRSAAQDGMGAAFVGQDVPYAGYCIDAMKDVLGEENVAAEFDSADTMKNYDALFSQFKSNGAAFAISLPITNNLRESIRGATKANMSFLCFAAQCLTRDIVSDLSSDELASVVAFDFEISDAFQEAMRAEVPDMPHEDVVAAAVAHDALVYAYTAHMSCGNPSAACIEKTADKPLVPTAIAARGFDDDRILRYDTRYVQFRDGGLRDAQ